MHRKIHVDTAEAYGNEIAIGEALAEARADAEFDPSNVFLATKLSSDAAVGYDGAKKRVADALQNLGVEHLDLFSLHSPFGFQHGEAALERVRGAWRALVELKASGAVRSLGLSNFGTAELRAFCLDPQLGGLELPDVLQNKFDPYRAGTQRPDGEDVEKACKELGILLVAYSTLSGWPFGAAGALSDPFIAQLAARYGAEPAQVLLRWAVDRGHAVIPRSSDAAHVRLNGNALEAATPPSPAEKTRVAAEAPAHATNQQIHLAMAPWGARASGCSDRQKVLFVKSK
ncbi:NADP-dependent oxidoreductase domain-containing protein [Pelagophyceae sp. CCMP2097]|nr:NADP-dependent oxidoreductase domain-containing protein [Pelagophyceae sp. CCMP2097]